MTPGPADDESKGISFFSFLRERVEKVDSLLCVGLDPHPELLSDPSATGAREFCLRLIEETGSHACAFKPNSAFFEVFGPPGWAALGDVIAAVPPEIPVILDAKRGDIASTARMYAQSVFETLGAHAVTLNPYLGYDAIEPFIEDPSRGVFLLCKTSNPGADAIQAIDSEGQPLYMRVAGLAQEWNILENVGLVIGATDPKALALVRAAAPALWLLAPGVGPQGADLAAALSSGLNADGLGMVIPISRAIAGAASPSEEAAESKEAINRIRSFMRTMEGDRLGRSEFDRSDAPLQVDTPEDDHISQLPLRLLEAGCVKFGDFELKSGGRSPIYFDLRLLTSNPELLKHVASAYLPILSDLEFDRLAAIPMAGIPIATAISLQTGHPMVYPRKERKGYGTDHAVEGGFKTGEVVVLIDDLATTAGSKLEAVERLEQAGLVVRDVVVLIDREGGAGDVLEQSDIQFHAIFTISDLMEQWEASNLVGEGDLTRVREYLAEIST